MHRCAEVHGSFSILANLIHSKSEQHVELGRSQNKHDNTDLQKLLLWFNCLESFNLTEFGLKSLSTGLLVSGDINCDNAEAVGETIQNVLHNTCIEDAVKVSSSYSSALESRG